MSPKIKRYSLFTFALLMGLIIGYFRPEASQSLLSILGIVVGIGYFFISSRELASTGQKKKKETSNSIDWFLLLQMLLFFIVGAALSVTIVYMIALY